MWSDEMKTEIEMELCSICFYKDHYTNAVRKIRCGDRMNEHCPGFKPIRTGTEVRR